VRIRRLSEDVANQIAAGEVVERPASAVKELVENALDAEASRVLVRVEEGGRRLIRVSDDGFGMAPDDAVAALERHATSKIRALEDIDAIATMGFRGEALPSIAAVSRFRLTTRRAEDEEGTQIQVEGGTVRAPARVGAPPGTQVEVASLFYNVPARLKFMKRPGTEMGHVSEAVTRLALACPRVSFRLESGDRVVLDAPAEVDADPRGRLGRILGRAAAERLAPISSDDRPHRIDVSGWISEPGFHERTSRSLYVFVNGRFVRDRGVQHAIQEAYRGHLERGRYPVVVLHLALPPGSFDVNVHPQKTEVRFASPQEVHRAVVGALARTLGAAPWRAPAVSPATWAQSVEQARRPQAAEGSPRASPRAETPDVGSAPAVDGASRRSMFPPRPTASLQESAAWAGRQWVREPRVEGYARGPDSHERPSELRLASACLVLGRYLVAEEEARAYLVDARAAAEKARWLDLEAHPSTAVQPLLVPVLVRLDPRRAACLTESLEALEAMGLACSDYGEHTIAVSTAPVGTTAEEIEALLIDLADEASRTRAEQRREAMRRRLARTVRLPRELSWAEPLLDRIALDARLRTGLDGARTMVELEAGALRRLFERD